MDDSHIVHSTLEKYDKSLLILVIKLLKKHPQTHLLRPNDV